MNQTLSQKRSAFALEKLYDLAKIAVIDDKFKAYAKGLPTLILTNGLAQAFAFILAKKKEEAKIIDWTISWLKQSKYIETENDRGEFMKKLSGLNQNEYLACQEETLLLWEWIKRYADSNLFQEKGE